MKPKELLDLRFGIVLTPALLPVIYRSVVALVGVLGICAIVAAFAHAWWWGVLALVVVPLVGAVVVGMVRVGCELLWYVNELHEDVSHIAARFGRMEDVVTELADEMPRLNFLRRGASNRERLVPDDGDVR
jgi:hypothetical protein